MKPHRPRWVALSAITLGIMVQPLNSTMIVIALPRIASALNVDASLSAWLITAYLLATVITQPALGKLSDQIGHRRMFIAGTALSGLSSLAASLAWNFPSLVAFRILQAIAGAAFAPSGVALLRDIYPAHERGRAFGIYSAVLGVTAASGPLIGGYLVSLADWPSIFYMSVPIIALAIALTLYAIPPRTREIPLSRKSFDVWGATALGVMLLALLLALLLGPRVGWSAPPAISSALIALVFCALFIAQERRATEPVVNLRLFRNVGFSAAVLSVFFQNMVMYSILIMMPLFLQNVQRLPATDAGWLLALLSATSALIAPLSGALSDWLGRRWPVVIGAALLLIGALLQTNLQVSTPVSWIAVGLTTAGIGLGLSGAAMQTSAVEAVSAEMAGVAAGLYSTMRYLGSTLGSALIGIALAGETHSATAFDRAFSWLVIAAVGALIVAWGLPPRRAHERRAELQSQASKA